MRSVFLPYVVAAGVIVLWPLVIRWLKRFEWFSYALVMIMLLTIVGTL